MAQAIDNFDLVVKNLISLHLVHDYQLKFNHPKLSEIIFDLYTYIKPKGRGAIDSIFTQLTGVTVNLLNAKAYIDNNKTSGAEYDKRLRIIIETTMENLTKLYPEDTDQNLVGLKTELNDEPFIQAFDLILKYLTVTYVNYYRLFTKAEENDFSLSSVRGPVPNLQFIDFTRGPLPPPIPLEVKKPPASDDKTQIPAKNAKGEKAPPQEKVSAEANVSSDIHSQEKPIIMVYLNPETTDFNRIFNAISEQTKAISPIRGEQNGNFRARLKVGAQGLAKISSFESNRYFDKKLKLTASKSPDNHDLLITGSPKTNYDGRLSLIVALLQGFKRVSSEFSLDFIIEPKKEAEASQPVKDIDIYDKSAEETACYEFKSIKRIVLASSLIGRRHINEGRPREDRFFIRSEPYSGWSVFAVADGAENTRFSRKGSEIACKSICDNFLKYFSNHKVVDYFQNNLQNLEEWHGYFTEKYGKSSYFHTNKHRNKLDLDKYVYAVVYRTYMAIYDESVAKSKESGLKFGVGDYDSTIQFLAVKMFPFGYFFISFGLGDGVIVLFDWNKVGEIMMFGAPDSTFSDEHNLYITRSKEITPEKVKNKTFFGFADSFDSIMLATDGVTDPFFKTIAEVTSEEKWLAFWNKNFKNGDGKALDLSSSTPPNIKAQSLKKWLAFDSSSDGDDRTIILIK